MIDERKVYTFFKNRYVIKKSTNGWWNFDCPFCVDGVGKKKHYIHFGYQHSKCYSCGFRGSAADFVMDEQAVSFKEASAILRAEESSDIDMELLQGIQGMRVASDVILPVGFVGLNEGKGTLGNRARKTLSDRGFDIDLLDMQGFGYCNEHNIGEDGNTDEDYFGYIIIPFKKDGKLQYFIGRDFIGNYLRYKNPKTETFGVGKGDLLYNEDAVNLYRKTWMTEGWSDAATMGKAGFSTQGWSLSNVQKSKILRGYTNEVNVIADKGFYKQAVKTALDFLDHKKVRVLNLDNEPGGPDENKDANEIGIVRVMEIYEETPLLTFGDAIEIINN